MLTIPIPLLVMHYLGDFPFQTDCMALNKSKSWWSLALHVTIYTLCFAPVLFMMKDMVGLCFLVITWLTHFLTDAITSRITAKLFFIKMRPLGEVALNPTKDVDWKFLANILPTRHWFFTMIGFDQLIHFVTLAITYKCLSGMTNVSDLWWFLG